MEIELDTDRNKDRNGDRENGQAGYIGRGDRYADNSAQNSVKNQAISEDLGDDLGVMRSDLPDQIPTPSPTQVELTQHPLQPPRQKKVQRTESLLDREIKRVRAEKAKLLEARANLPASQKVQPKIQPKTNIQQKGEPLQDASRHKERSPKQKTNSQIKSNVKSNLKSNISPKPIPTSDLVPYAEPTQTLALANDSVFAETLRDRDASRRDPKHQKAKSPKSKKYIPQGNFGWSDLFVILSVPILGCGIFLGVQFLSNPLSLSWLYSTQAPIFTPSLWNQPKTLAQVKAELAESQLILGDSLELKTGEQIYAVLQAESKTIREIRLYHPISDRGSEKLVLITSLQTPGLEELVVKAPFVKYRSAQVSNRSNYKRMPMTKLKAIAGTAPDRGTWFVAYGKDEDTTYGQIFHYTPDPQPTMVMLKDWVSPLGEFPKWQVALSGSSKDGTINSLGNKEQEAIAKPQLLVNQSIDFEPIYSIYQVEDNIASESKSYIQLRQITLNEGLGLPRSYSEALTLASSGLWSSALTKLNVLKQELKAKGKTFSPFVQEQYDLIALHATLTSGQAKQPYANFGEQVFVKIIDGHWQEALEMAESASGSAEKIAAMVAKYDKQIWMRVQTGLQLEPSQALKVWGGLVVLNREGLRASERWLRAQKADSKEVMALLQRLDLTPIALNPQQLLGTVSYLGKGNPGAQWQITPPELLTGQGWYVIDVAIARDGDIWKNAPFPELGDRSSLFAWKVLGLEQNNRLGIAIADNASELITTSLLAQSLSIDGYGNIRILAMGNADLAKSLNTGSVPTLVTSGGGISDTRGQNVYLTAIAPEVATSITNTLYGQLGRYGQVSLNLKDFSQQLQQWLFQAIDLDGDGNPELILELQRSQIDLGNRHYPMVAVFTSTGRLLFSDIGNRTRRWIGVLPSKVGGQILTEINGYYEVWSLR
jgi:hypothetical protein